ncbi:MAG: PAS domain S-box protein [Bryobacterales bacterium]|nr:PAS domain S-box protein [Bryobacterales bacterium]
MLQELKFQLSTAILTVLTVAAVISAGINFHQQQNFHLPEDGVTWIDRGNAITALLVAPRSQAAKAGLRVGDQLVKINGAPVERASVVTQVLVGVGTWNKAEYQIRRDGVVFKANVIVGESFTDSAVYYLYAVGLAYLTIGLFVYFRRGSAPKARHFYVLCLASFVFSTFHYTGKLNNFDKVIYWGNVVTGLFSPTIFLHFCLTFPERRRWLSSKLRVTSLYLPAALLLAIYVGSASGGLLVTIPLIELRIALDRIWLLLWTVLYLAGGFALNRERKRAEDPIVRRQLRWLENGVFWGIVPFAVLYVAPFTLGAPDLPALRISVLSLLLIPLTFAYAIVRYRLMDVDVLFRRGYAYTLATLCVLAAFYGIVFSLGSLVQKNFKDLGNLGLISVMLLASFLFQPIRTWIQERLDKFFYRDRYDYRLTLVEFARELSSETDLDAMLSSVAERLKHTLSIHHVAIFLADEAVSSMFQLRLAAGLEDRSGRTIMPGDLLDLRFLAEEHGKPYIFFERTRYQLDAISRQWPPSVRETISDLDLTYYLPCSVRGRTIGYLGVSRTDDGDFLSSVDLELLVTLSGYVGIAIDNAQLYRSLERKAREYERLKEYSENIVESINVGILAADLEDRVESWNTQIEQLTGIPRHEAMGRKLNELFPPDLAAQFDGVLGKTGIHHIYKFTLRPPAVHAPANGNGSAKGNGNGHPAPREVTLNIAIAPLVSKDNEQIGRLVIFDDVTVRAELEKRLVQADKLSSIGLLAAGVAHEVNTPLAVISTYAQMLTKQVGDDEHKARMLDKIAKQTFRASEIVNSLLNFSRTSTTDFVEVSLNKVIQETLSLIQHQMEKAGVRIDLELAPELSPMTGNPGKLQQVFLNLFLNARDAMDTGGVLTVRTSNGSASDLRVDVSDTGHGIPEAVLGRIYDPFFTTKTDKKGTGLGLSVTYGIVHEHGGSIEVFSRSGGGARFHLEFPSRHPAAGPSETARSTAALPVSAGSDQEERAAVNA